VVVMPEEALGCGPTVVVFSATPPWSTGARLALRLS
jgi:hypothetical protein